MQGRGAGAGGRGRSNFARLFQLGGKVCGRRSHCAVHGAPELGMGCGYEGRIPKPT